MRREIVIGGVSSLTLGLTVDSEQSLIGDAQPRYIVEALPYKDGSLDFSKADGSLHYDDRTLTYVFNVKATTPAALESKRSQVVTWLMAGAGGDLIDSYRPGYKFTGIRPKVNSVTIVSRNHTICKIQAVIAAAPYMVSVTDPTERRL